MYVGYFSPSKRSIAERILDFPALLGPNNTTGLFAGNEITTSSMERYFCILIFLHAYANPFPNQHISNANIFPILVINGTTSAFPMQNIAFVQAFLYLSSHPGNHLIVRIQLESALVGDRSSGPVRHGKSGPPGILRSASFLRACPTVPEIERCPQKNNIDCHLAAAVSHALPPWSRSIGACLRCEGNSAHPLDLFLICPLEAWLLLAAELHQQSISVRSS